MLHPLLRVEKYPLYIAENASFHIPGKSTS